MGGVGELAVTRRRRLQVWSVGVLITGLISVPTGTVMLLGAGPIELIINETRLQHAIDTGYCTCEMCTPMLDLSRGHIAGFWFETEDFAVRMVLFGVCMIALAGGIAFLARRTPGVGDCQNCGYSIAGIALDICPECGSPNHDAPR